MRKCDYCEKQIPLGSNRVEVRIIGFQQFKNANKDFCGPLCFELYYHTERHRLSLTIPKHKGSNKNET